MVKTGRNLIYWRHFDNGEKFQNYLKVFIDISELGYEVIGVTSDWHGSIVGAVKYLYPSIPHQRCLVHTQRRCEDLLTKKPKTEAGIELLTIVKLLNMATSHDEANIWRMWLSRWEDRYGLFIKERTYGYKDDGTPTWWYTHKNLRSAYRCLSISLSHLFLYLDYEGLDKDTNGLEAEFSHLSQKIGMHRGLKRHRRVAAYYWYVYFKNLERSD